MAGVSEPALPRVLNYAVSTRWRPSIYPLGLLDADLPTLPTVLCPAIPSLEHTPPPPPPGTSGSPVMR